MSNKGKYGSIASGTQIQTPYQTPKNDFLDLLKGEDAMSAISQCLGNRKDHCNMIVSTILNSPKIWGWFISVFVAISSICYLLCSKYPTAAEHIAEKTINKVVPDLLPIPPESKQLAQS